MLEDTRKKDLSDHVKFIEERSQQLSTDHEARINGLT